MENCDISSLQAAEQQILEGETLMIEVRGDDEGEQLTHVMAAIEILQEVQSGTEIKDALRNYTKRVRESIS